MNSTQKEIDDALAELSAARERFAGLSPGERRLLIVDCIPKVVSVAEEWIAAGCQSKGSHCTPAIVAENRKKVSGTNGVVHGFSREF